MAKAGRKEKFSEADFIKAVISKRSLADSEIGEVLGVTRSTIYRWKQRNPESVDKASKELNGIENIRFDGIVSRDQFVKIPSVEHWLQIVRGRDVGESRYEFLRNGLYRLCKYYQVHPDRVTLEFIAPRFIELKEHHQRTGKHIQRGMSWIVLREIIRSWLSLEKKIPPDIISARGITKTDTKGTGKYSRMKVTKEQRKRYAENLRKVVYEKINDQPLQYYLETLMHSKLMFYTGTRKSASLSIRLNDPQNIFEKDVYSIHIIDKGRHGGIHWQKIFVEDSLRTLKTYISERFGIPLDQVDQEAPRLDSYLFPIIHGNGDRLTSIMKEALELSGAVADIPNHIWRHTFAQEFLNAKDWNFALTASLGGWKDERTLRKHYGDSPEQTRIRALRSAMGYEVKDATTVFLW